MTYRIIVTGERDWVDQSRVWAALNQVVSHVNRQDIVIVHGDCLTGADHHAELFARNNRITVERHPAKWYPFESEPHKLDLGAGPKRNTVMVDLGANICCAFWSGKVNGSGTFDCLTKAVKARIPVRIVPK